MGTGGLVLTVLCSISGTDRSEELVDYRFAKWWG